MFSLTAIRCLCLAIAAVLVSAGQADAQEKSSKSQSKAKQPAEFAWVNKLPAKYGDVVEHGAFESDVVDESVGYCVLLPPGYNAESNSSKRYAVVYYLHGGRPGSETKAIGLAPMLKAAMDAGRVPGMIYVFVNGGPVSHYNVPDRVGAVGKDVFVNELIPHIDTKYRTIADREHRGLEGFSQGGRGTARIGFRHPELFCSIAPGGGGHETERRISESGGEENQNLVFAEGDNTYDLARSYAASEKAAPLNVLIYVGTKGFNYQNNLAYMKFLSGLGISYQRLIVEGVPHSAKGIYEKQCDAIMRFHARNFALLD